MRANPLRLGWACWKAAQVSHASDRWSALRLVLEGARESPRPNGRLQRIRLAVDGSSVVVHARLCPSDADIFREVFVDGSYAWPYTRWAPEVKVVVDLGAHIGLSSAYFRARFPGARIISVEPLAENLSVLLRTADANSGPWDVVPAAVGTRAGERASFYWSGWWSSGTTLHHIGKRRQTNPARMEHRLARPSIDVDVVDIPWLMQRFALERIDILKVDIEGAEEHLFADSPAWLDDVGCVAVEIHDRYIDGRAVRAALRHAGFCSPAVGRGRSELFVRCLGV